MHVDINGAKPPNQFGRDMFIFHISKEGVIPTGTQFVNVPAYTFENSCKMSGNGTSCSAWVILNENMDYLRCNDLSWDGKTKCK